ncbi:MAG: hypothetical protein WC441_04835 [Patescibacteria group bacterium]
MIISKNVNLAHGLINAIDPSSPSYPEGAAYVSTNSRIDENGTWNKGPSLTYTKISGDDERSASGNIVLGSNNKVFVCSGGLVTGGKGGLVSPPSISVSKSGSLIGARQESGIYFYMGINDDATYNLESLPSAVVEHWIGKQYDTTDVRVADVPVLSGAVNTKWYRSTVIKAKKGDTVQLGNLFELNFYYLGKGATWNDYANDNEIAKPENLYRGRGSFRPTTGIDAIGSINNRMFYFVDNIAYFSSSGRPEEVPQEYTLTINHTYSSGIWTTGTFKEQLTIGSGGSSVLTRKPLLDSGLKAACKMPIMELIGKTVIRAENINGKLWVFTADSIGYISPTDVEGFRYTHVAEGFGLCSAWTLASTPYGVFGADSKGLWLLTEFPRRLNLGKIDIFDSSKDTYFNPANLGSSRGVWVGELNEYWWSLSGKQIVYQADKDRFVGCYNLSVESKVAYVSGLYQQHLVRSGNTPILDSRSGTQTLKFWLGQESGGVVKQELDIDVLYTGITNGYSVTVSMYQNQRASETSAMSSTEWLHTDADLVGKLKPINSGRYFEISLSVPAACTAPISGIVYSALGVVRRERALR